MTLDTNSASASWLSQIFCGGGHKPCYAPCHHHGYPGPVGVYVTPGYAAPGYAAPGYAAPGYGAPGYGAPVYAAPGYATPGYGSGYGYGPAPVPNYAPTNNYPTLAPAPLPGVGYPQLGQ